MSMFIKSALAMLITVGFAGGAVYYGTNDPQSVSNEVDLRAPEKIETKKPVTKKPKPKKTVTTKTVETTETSITEDIKGHSPTGKVKPVPEEISSAVPGSQSIPELEPEPVFDPEVSLEIPAQKNADNVPTSGINLARIMPMLMAQAEKISTPEIKDQAYLDIVNFSVSQGQFKFADAAMQKINQTELRDTARSQIAIGLALGGRADDAFEVIDAVEIDTLRDVMRLQVIEALIVPGKLPPGLAPGVIRQ